MFLRSLFDGLLPLVVNSLRRLAKTHTLVVHFCVRSLTVCLLALVALVCYVWIFCGNVMVVWIFFVNFVVEMLMDNRR